MRARTVKIPLLLLLGLASGLHAHCGMGRWTVKTAADGDAAALINLDQPMDVTVREIYYWHGGQPYSKGELRQRADTRMNSQERTIYRVRGFLKNFRIDSDDDDYQLVISDEDGNSLVAAIPSPDCAAKSRFIDQLKSARAAFAQHHQAGADFLKEAIHEPVEIIGPGFFGIPEGQAYCAPNFVEIHPVLKISFGAEAAAPAPTAAGAAGGTGLAEEAGLCRYKGQAYSAGALECMFGHVYECGDGAKWQKVAGESCR
jgi:hypothetical protein